MNDNISDNFENDMKMKKLREELSKSFEQYKNTMRLLTCDAPIEILCLPNSIEKVLLNSGYLRVYDLIDLDLTEIKGLDLTRAGQLTSCLDQFFSMT